MIHVVAAAVVAADGRILIAQRPVGRHLAGGWEFPGGKIEPGESLVQALTRELSEELGITLTAQPRPLMRLRHSYPYGDVLLDMWVVTRYTGEPCGLDGQAIRWCTQEDLEAAKELLPADRPVVRALRLPQRLTAMVTQDYAVGAIGDSFDAAKLRGLLCLDAAAAVGAVRYGAADFLVMQKSATVAELASICATVDVPVFGCVPRLEEAWALGLSGINDL